MDPSFIILLHSFAESQRASPSRINDAVFFSPPLPALGSGSQCKIGPLEFWTDGSRLSLSLHSSSHFLKPFCCQKMQLFSDAHQALPLAMAIRSDTLLMGTPLRVTLTWMKRVAGDRLEPSAFNKWTCRYPAKEARS